jgi:hypothetical protein
MLSKSGEVTERCHLDALEFVESSPSAFLSPSPRQDDEAISRPPVPGATSPHAGADLESTSSSRKPGAVEIPEIPPQEGVAITISVIEGPSAGLT